MAVHRVAQHFANLRVIAIYICWRCLVVKWPVGQMVNRHKRHSSPVLVSHYVVQLSIPMRVFRAVGYGRCNGRQGVRLSRHVSMFTLLWRTRFLFCFSKSSGLPVAIPRYTDGLLRHDKQHTAGHGIPNVLYGAPHPLLHLSLCLAGKSIGYVWVTAQHKRPGSAAKRKLARNSTCVTSSLPHTSLHSCPLYTRQSVYALAFQIQVVIWRTQ